MNSTVKTIMFWAFIVICLMLLFGVVQRSAVMGGKEQEVPFSLFLEKVQQNQVNDVTVQGMDVHGHYKNDGKEQAQFHTMVPVNYPDMYTQLNNAKVSTTIKDAQGNLFWPILIQVGPLVLILGIWFFIMRQMQSGGNKAMSFGKSRARLLSMQQKKITFKDVAGVDEAKEELKEIIEYLREPQKLPEAWRPNSQGRASSGASGNR